MSSALSIIRAELPGKALFLSIDGKGLKVRVHNFLLRFEIFSMIVAQILLI